MVGGGGGLQQEGGGGGGGEEVAEAAAEVHQTVALLALRGKEKCSHAQQ